MGGNRNDIVIKMLLGNLDNKCHDKLKITRDWFWLLNFRWSNVRFIRESFASPSNEDFLLVCSIASRANNKTAACIWNVKYNWSLMLPAVRSTKCTDRVFSGPLSSDSMQSQNGANDWTTIRHQVFCCTREIGYGDVGHDSPSFKW